MVDLEAVWLTVKRYPAVSLEWEIVAVAEAGY